MRTAGFSLIELMVVVAIIAILAAVAVPSYNTYINKVKISKAIDLSSYWAKQALQNYNTEGNISIPLSISNNQIYSNMFILDDKSQAYALYTYSPGDSSIVVLAAIAGLKGVEGYIDPATVPADPYLFSNAAYSTVGVAVKVTDGVAEFQCGSSFNSPSGIPANMLPAGCKCDVWYWTLGYGC